MNTLTIGDLAARTGVAPSALRFYERRGLLKPVGRAGGKRTYEQGAVEQVAVVDLLKVAGFTLAEVAQIVDADGRVNPDWREVARARLADLEAQLEFVARAKEMLEHTIACPHPTPDRCPVFSARVAAHARSMADRAGYA
ncbi:MAG TPA: MerR family transcriptional regulator [Actinomycetota bacterium]|nr:MerR family transcriptional regulator [Actinomycetota bacterium]